LQSVAILPAQNSPTMEPILN